MSLYNLEAVVLRSRNLGEADKIITLYSRERGKVRAVAREHGDPGTVCGPGLRFVPMASILYSKTEGWMQLASAIL